MLQWCRVSEHELAVSGDVIVCGQETEIIDDIQITNMNEDFVEDTFLQNINIEITLK